MYYKHGYIYDDIIKEHGLKIAEQCGYFDTVPNFVSTKNYLTPDEIDTLIKPLDKDHFKTFNNLSTIMYYPGAFTVFHDGHLDLIKQSYEFIKEKTNNFFIVIAPANRDYIVEKYPNLHITDKARYEFIKQGLVCLPDDIKKHLIIDLQPMLNNIVDLNFTTLVKYFMNTYNPQNNTIPYIICGKDKDFNLIEKYTNKLKVFVGKENIKRSSKDFVDFYYQSFNKKDCIFRCNTEKEFNLFIKYFSQYYNNIIPSYFFEEIEKLTNICIDIPFTKNIITICKDYKNTLQYIPFSRQFENALEGPSFNFPEELKQYDPAYTFIFDSDSYTGETKKYLESFGFKVICILENINTKTTEIVDIEDLLDNNKRYPNYDVTERMSLPVLSCYDGKLSNYLQSLMSFKEELIK